MLVDRYYVLKLVFIGLTNHGKAFTKKHCFNEHLQTELRRIKLVGAFNHKNEFSLDAWLG